MFSAYLIASYFGVKGFALALFDWLIFAKLPLTISNIYQSMEKSFVPSSIVSKFLFFTNFIPFIIITSHSHWYRQSLMMVY
jgi:alanine-alpha-ketoisovalerate/valine-pyruvate aminotransferase